MKVKELIKALEKCDQEAEVFTEAFNTSMTLTVAEYVHKEGKGTNVYIADQLNYVDDTMLKLFDKRVIVEEGA